MTNSYKWIVDKNNNLFYRIYFDYKSLRAYITANGQWNNEWKIKVKIVDDKGLFIILNNYETVKENKDQSLNYINDIKSDVLKELKNIEKGEM